jgi:serine protease Do
MTQTTVPSTQSSFPLPDVFSSALTTLFQSVQPGVVQVRVDEHGGGTGVVWHADGRIITNNHVVPRDDAKVQVTFSDGRVLSARVLQHNPRLDLALLKVDDGDNLRALPFGDSSRLRVGEYVFAVGHPWGQRWALTAGVMSAISTARLADDLTTQYIKSDVALAPGNSGGPLLNADGEVVGINAMIFGGDLAVSIPSNVVSTWLAQAPRGRVGLGIGVQTVELPASARQALTPPRSTGLLIAVLGNEQNNLLLGDILLDVADKPVSDAATLRQVLAQRQAGETLSLKLLRGGVQATVNAVVQALD